MHFQADLLTVIRGKASEGIERFSNLADGPFSGNAIRGSRRALP